MTNYQHLSKVRSEKYQFCTYELHMNKSKNIIPIELKKNRKKQKQFYKELQ